MFLLHICHDGFSKCVCLKCAMMYDYEVKYSVINSLKYFYFTAFSIVLKMDCSFFLFNTDTLDKLKKVHQEMENSEKSKIKK